MEYKFGKTSQIRLNTTHKDLQTIMHYAIQRSEIDFGIAEGYRSLARQQVLFKEGKTKIDGITKTGKHNIFPSMAVDIYAYYDNKAQWDKESLIFIAGVIHTAAKILLNMGLIEHKIRWGGNWDMDGKIIKDQSFIDLPHFELISIK